MPAVKMFGALLGGVAECKWDRFATFGEKIQDGQKFSFSVETFGQMVDNFARMFSGRRLGMDYEHQAMNAAQNGKPAPCLAYYNALCVVEAGQVVKFYAQKPDVPPPDPTLLLVQLRERFPDYDTADGLWGYRCEVTPLGRELLPNYEQISPLFTADGTDEQQRPIGYHLMNVSAVNVAFQDGTVLFDSINKRALAQSDSSLHVPVPETRKGSKMADKEEKDEGEKPSALRSECMKKLGLPDDASDDAMYGALMAQKFGDLEIKHEDEDDKPKDMGAMAESPEMPAAMSALKSRVDEEARARADMERELAELRAEQRQRKVHAWHAFSSQYLAPEAAEKYLSAHKGDIDAATLSLSALGLSKRSGIYETMTAGGKPMGAADVQADGETVTPHGNPTIGLGLARKAREYAQKHSVALSEAYVAVAPRKRSPSYF